MGVWIKWVIWVIFGSNKNLKIIKAAKLIGSSEVLFSDVTLERTMTNLMAETFLNYNHLLQQMHMEAYAI